ncbi:MAG: hypothetical protein HOV83_00865 [Catenulispora sp.]|nr:hypothetical protein [Catenulispora sp.]
MSAPANGTEIGAYSINMGFPASVPLGADKPKQTDFDSRELTGDLATSYPADHLIFVPVQNNGDKMYSLPGGSILTYAACAGATVTSTQADSAAGTAFCVSAPGRMIGVKVTSVVPRQYAVLSVTVWQNI